MRSEHVLTVHDAVSQPVFHKAKVVAGKNGLNRIIRWVHVLEASNVEALLHGGEMILSTGIGLNSLPVQSFMEKLIENQVSCLCIELGNYVNSISDEIIRTADRHDFPLIIFEETVRFVDITQDLHAIIINRHHKMLGRLESTSIAFNRLILTFQGMPQILKLLHKSTDSQVAFFPSQGVPQYIPTLQIAEQNMLAQAIRQREASRNELLDDEILYQWKDGDTTFLIQPIGAMGQNWANLLLAVKRREPQEFDVLILDRAALALSQDLLRKKYMDERRLHSENLWVNDLINNRIKTEEQVKSLLGSRFKDTATVQHRVCVIDNVDAIGYESDTSEEEQEAGLLHMALWVRSIFEKLSFHPLMTTKGNQLVVVAIDLARDKNEKQRLDYIYSTLQSRTQLRFGVGRAYKKFTDAPFSHQEAQGVLRINHIVHGSMRIFYEDIGIYRLLLNLENETTARLFIEDSLGPLIEHDRAKSSELVRTLKVFFNNQGSKQISAQELFLTRQTLYYRLNKIKELLGEDFASPERRLAIEVAIRAHDMFN